MMVMMTVLIPPLRIKIVKMSPFMIKMMILIYCMVLIIMTVMMMMIMMILMKVELVTIDTYVVFY